MHDRRLQLADGSYPPFLSCDIAGNDRSPPTTTKRLWCLGSALGITQEEPK